MEYGAGRRGGKVKLQLAAYSVARHSMFQALDVRLHWSGLPPAQEEEEAERRAHAAEALRRAEENADDYDDCCDILDVEGC